MLIVPSISGSVSWQNSRTLLGAVCHIQVRPRYTRNAIVVTDTLQLGTLVPAAPLSHARTSAQTSAVFTGAYQRSSDGWGGFVVVCSSAYMFEYNAPILILCGFNRDRFWKGVGVQINWLY